MWILIIVNIYHSLTAKVTEDSIGLEKSGLVDLESKINQFIKSWKGEVFTSVKNNIVFLLKETENSLIRGDKVIN